MAQYTHVLMKLLVHFYHRGKSVIVRQDVMQYLVLLNSYPLNTIIKTSVVKTFFGAFMGWVLICKSQSSTSKPKKKPIWSKN